MLGVTNGTNSKTTNSYRSNGDGRVGITWGVGLSAKMLVKRLHVLVLIGYTCCLPGITEIVFKALSTLNVRRADTLPRFTNSVTYLQGNL